MRTLRIYSFNNFPMYYTTTVMATHSSILAWKIPWMEEPGRLQSMGLQSQTWLSDFIFFFFLLFNIAIMLFQCFWKQHKIFSQQKCLLFSSIHYIYYCRQESLRRNGVAIMVNSLYTIYIKHLAFVLDSTALGQSTGHLLLLSQVEVLSGLPKISKELLWTVFHFRLSFSTLRYIWVSGFCSQHWQPHLAHYPT